MNGTCVDSIPLTPVSVYCDTAAADVAASDTGMPRANDNDVVILRHSVYV